MASVQTGKAVVYGFPGNFTVGTVFVATYIKESGDVSSTIKIDEIRDEDNELVGLVHSGETLEMTLMMTPVGTGASGQLADAKKQLSAPLIGSKITLVNFHDDDVPFINGTWAYVGGFKVAFKKDGIASYEIKLMRHRTNDIALALT